MEDQSQPLKLNPSNDNPVVKPKETNEPIENRLVPIFSCVVCLNLPLAAVYQCKSSHLVCNDCFIHILADANLQDKIPKCPNCRQDISNSKAIRNLAIENAVNHLKYECQYCYKLITVEGLKYHELNECDERIVACKYSWIGCQWRGTFCEATIHGSTCEFPKKTGAEVMNNLGDFEAEKVNLKTSLYDLTNLLNQETVITSTFKIRPEHVGNTAVGIKLFYEAVFSTLGEIWSITLVVNDGSLTAHQMTERRLSYQISLKTKTKFPISLYFTVTKSSSSNIKLKSVVYYHCFTNESSTTIFNWFPLEDTMECNRQIASKTIDFSLIMGSSTVVGA